MANAFGTCPHLLDEVVSGADVEGLPEGRELHTVRSAAWATSSEMAGEVGQVLLRLSERPMSADLRKKVEQSLREVRKVWPRFGKAWWQW